MTAKIFTVERTTTEKLDYKFDLAEVTNGRDGAVADVLESGEEIASYTLISSDVDLVVSDDALTDSNTSISFLCLAVTWQMLLIMLMHISSQTARRLLVNMISQCVLYWYRGNNGLHEP